MALIARSLINSDYGRKPCNPGFFIEIQDSALSPFTVSRASVVDALSSTIPPSKDLFSMVAT